MHLNRRLFIASSAALASGAFSSRFAFAADPIIETAQGKVRGVVADNGIHVFKGMRYGKAERFMLPMAPSAWSGIQDAFEYGDQSPQARGSLAASQAMSDDCLRINVWTPGLDNAKRPVLLWFHGGGFEAGSGSSRLYDGTRVARRGDVAVAIERQRR